MGPRIPPRPRECRLAAPSPAWCSRCRGELPDEEAPELRIGHRRFVPVTRCSTLGPPPLARRRRRLPPHPCPPARCRCQGQRIPADYLRALSLRFCGEVRMLASLYHRIPGASRGADQRATRSVGRWPQAPSSIRPRPELSAETACSSVHPSSSAWTPGREPCSRAGWQTCADPTPRAGRIAKSLGKPAGNQAWSPWGRHAFLGLFTTRQVLEKRCGYGGSTKAISVERDSFREEQPLQSLLVVERLRAHGALALLCEMSVAF